MISARTALLLALLALPLGCDEEPADVAQQPELPTFDFDFGPQPVPDSDGPPDVDGPEPELPPFDEDAEEAEVDVEADVPDACTPDCAGRQCGNDGCGGLCGTCLAGRSCEDGSCVLDNDTCAGVIEVGALPWTVAGTTDGKTDVNSCAAGEEAQGSGAPDALFEFLPPTDGPYRATLTADWPARLLVTTSCGLAGQCLAVGEPGEEVVFQSPAGGPLTLAVDGAEAGASGSFTLTVQGCQGPCSAGFCGVGKCGISCTCGPEQLCVEESCVPVPEGDSCGDEILVDALPFSHSGSLALHTDAVSCQAGGTDVIYQLSPADPLGIQVALTGGEGVVAYLTSDCAAAPACTGTLVEVGETRGLSLLGDVTTRLVVDGPQEAEWSLSIAECPPDGCSEDCPCGAGVACIDGSCQVPSAGDTCAEPVPLAPGSNAHSTAGLAHSVACGSPAPLREAIFSFTAPSAGTWQITATAGRPLAIYTMATCGADATCSPVASSPPRLSVDLDDGEEITVVVEEVIPGPGGSFLVQVTDCAGACVGLSCDAVVCGVTCGCPAGESCLDGACLASPPLDTCATAQDITTVPWAGQGTLSTLTDAMACGAAGAGSPDAVYRFIAPTTGVYAFSLIGDGAPLLLRPTTCSGTALCATAASPLQVAFAHTGDVIPLVVDSLDGSTTGYQLSAVRVIGYPGSLGAACDADSDCPLADACVAGVCTIRCDPESALPQCQSAVAGPRGSKFGCPSDVCVPLPGGDCASMCQAGVSDGAITTCSATSDCVLGNHCAGYLRTPDGTVTGTCMAPGTLANTSQPCAGSSECASNVCDSGACGRLCGSQAHCDDNARCHLNLVGDQTVVAPGGLCRVLPGLLPGACTADEDCPDSGVCDGFLAPDGALETWCRAPGDGLPVGTACATGVECALGRCLFEGFVGLNQPYCTGVCTGSDDCPTGLSCRSFTLWDGGTPGITFDDYALPLCVSGISGASCPLAGADLCDEGLACTDLGADPAFGICQ